MTALDDRDAEVSRCAGRRGHLTASDYFAACRCPAARDAVAIYEKRRRLAQLSGTPLTTTPHGTQRRLRALAVMGWPFSAVAERLNVTPDAVSDMARRPRAVVFRSTAQRIAAIYDELSMTPGPSTIARRRAAAKGWLPPLAWDDDEIDDPTARARRVPRVAVIDHVDEIAVEEAIAGRRVKLNKHERREAVRRMQAKGMTAAQISVRLHTSRHAAQRLATRTRARDAA